MALIRWEPFREMEEMFRQYSPLLRQPSRELGEITSWRPVADITETDKEFLIKAELPDVKKEDVKLTLNEGVLTISGERKQEKEKKEENDIRIERFYGSFARSFALPESADTGKIQAEIKDGVLRVRIPKREAKQAKPVSIEVH
jgi:HSP20 family protein